MKVENFAHSQVAFTTTVLSMLDPMRRTTRAAFGASCAERLFPLYAAFVENSQSGDPAFVRQALNDLWTFTIDLGPTASRYRDYPERLLPFVPSSELYTSAFTFAAQYAISCIIHAYRACDTEMSEEAAWCSIVSRDCLTEDLMWLAKPIYVNPPEPIMRELEAIDWFDQPLLQHELKKQMNDLELLSSCRRVDDRIIHRLRNEGARGIDPFTRGLVAEPAG